MPLIFFLALQEGPVLDSFKQIVHEWNISHLDAQVELTHFVDYGAPAREALAMPREDAPTFVLAPEYMTSTMMGALKEKRIIPISELLDQEKLDEIAEIVKYTFGDKEGNLSSLPLNPSCGVIYSNKDLLKAGGIDPNYIPESLEQLESICQVLIQKGVVTAGYTTAWPPAYLIEVPAAQQDIPLVIPDNGKLGYGEYVLSQEWLKQHLLDIRKQQKNGTYLYAGKDNNSRKPFIERKVAFFMQGSPHYQILQREASGSMEPFEVGSGPLPSLFRGQEKKHAFPLGGASIWVLDNAKTEQMIQGVRAFLNYLTEIEIQEKWHKETAYVPVLKALPKQLSEFYEDHPLHKAVVEQTIEATLGTYSFGIHAPNYGEARKEMFDLIERILSPETNDQEVETLLKQFDEKFS